jgi:prolyl oligopeptidase
MKRLALLLVLVPLTLFAQPPATRRSDFAEKVHGVNIADPYRWLEEMDSPETKAWVQAQSNYAKAYLGAIPGRDKLMSRVGELSRTTKSSTAVQLGKRLFYTKQEPGDNQPILYCDSGEGPKMLINPNLDSAKGISALTGWQPSPDGKLLAYSTAVAGSDWNIIRVRDIDTGHDLSDKIEWTKFSTPEWAADSKSFFYSRYPQPKASELLSAQSLNQKVYHHTLNTAQSADRLIFERPDQPEWRFSAALLAPGQLLIRVNWGTRKENLLYLVDPNKPGVAKEIVGKFEAQFEPVGYREGLLFLFTSSGAPKGRVIALDPANPQPANWAEIVPESKDTISGVEMHGDMLALESLRDVKTVLSTYSARQRKLLREVQLPGIGSASWGPSNHHFGRLMGAEKTLYYTFSSFTQPATLYRYDTASGASTALFPAKLAFDPADFETRQVFYSSKEGSSIPMFLISKKGLKKTGQVPVLLYAYGGFNLSSLPNYNSRALAWAEMGGVYAVANIRGGGEYGEAWHSAGKLNNKQNVFDDFIAAAEFLIRDGYTTPKKIGIIGGSNGGLLVGAVLNQRPDLFGAAVPAVGVMDMLRFHKFTVGAGWTSDYGNPDNAKDFEVLRKYSPIHNIRKGTQYPPTLVITADHDDRVVPLHSFKYGAALQYAQEGRAPILLRIETEAGHGAGKPVAKQVEETADILAFLKQSLQLP